MLLILGLDGATLDLVEPWASQGVLPNLSRLMAGGAWGRLASTVPPATFPSWTTFMTGVNPGRHGIFDFARREPGSYSVRFVNATFRRSPTIWRILSDAGRRVSVLGLPGTYPPEPINGCMISGFDTPVTTRADASFVHPPEFARDVERLGGFPFADFQEFRIGPDWHRRALESLLAGIERKTRLAELLIGRERWDCLMLLFGESDTVAHHFWRFHDPNSPRFNAREAEALGNAVRTVYAALDAAVGRLCDCVASQVLVVSDHGFGGAGDTAVFLNRWLEEHGLLSWEARSPMAGMSGWARSAALKAIPQRWQAPLFRLGGGRIAGAIESGARFGGIDWRNTRAVSEELNYYPSIWLNVQGREPLGVVTREHYHGVCEEIREALLAWRDPFRDGPVVRKIWHRDELYNGNFVENSPDLVLDLNRPGGYSYVCLPSRGQSGPSVIRLEGSDLSGGKLSGMSGSHREDGLFILAGEEISPGRIDGAWIADMAPTILSLCGLPVPGDWDGRVLSAVEGRSEGRSEMLVAPSLQAYDAASEAEIEERLRQLGYLA